jgi:hypothetical protein
MFGLPFKPIKIDHDLHTFTFMITFTSCFTFGKAHRSEGDIPKMWGELDYNLILHPLILVMSPTHRLYPKCKHHHIKKNSPKKPTFTLEKSALWFLFFQFCDVASTSGDHPWDNLAKKLAKQNMKIKSFKHPFILLASYIQDPDEKNLAIFFDKRFEI